MISYFQAIFLGILQGLAEFLPISSSGHLIIAPWLFRWPDPGLGFDVALHIGTLMPLFFYFLKDWLDMLFKKRNLLWLIILATIPGGIAGLLFEKQAETIFRNPMLIALNLTIFGILLYYANAYSSNEVRSSRISSSGINLKTSLITGFAQILAIIPGVSRSGITYTAGRLQKLDHQTAAKFSFLLATPIIAATILKLPELFKANDINYSLTGVGFLASIFSSWLALYLFMNKINKKGLNYLVGYRILLAIIIAAVYFTRL